MQHTGAAIRSVGLTKKKARGQRFPTCSQVRVESSQRISRYEVIDSVRDNNPSLFPVLDGSVLNSSSSSSISDTQNASSSCRLFGVHEKSLQTLVIGTIVSSGLHGRAFCKVGVDGSNFLDLLSILGFFRVPVSSRINTAFHKPSIE
jgi:hypothetical protein